MKPKFWKILASYLTEIPIEHVHSEINGHLSVNLQWGRYQLCTENAIYSFSDLYDNFAKTFNQLNYDKLPGGKVLILGFGLGSIVEILEKRRAKNFEYTGVEVDETVIFLAEKYTLSNLDVPIEIICTDALHYVYSTSILYDLICVDVYLDDKIPAPFEEISFLEALKDTIHPDGVILFNRLSRKKEDLQQTAKFYDEKFRFVFPNATYLDVGGNWMLVSNRQCLL